MDLEELLWVRTPTLPDKLPLLRANSDAVTLSPARQIVVNSAALTRSILAEGGACALFPSFAVREALAQGVLSVPFPDLKTSPIPVYALFTERRTKLGNAKAFVEVLLAEL